MKNVLKLIPMATHNHLKLYSSSNGLLNVARLTQIIEILVSRVNVVSSVNMSRETSFEENRKETFNHELLNRLRKGRGK